MPMKKSFKQHMKNLFKGINKFLDTYFFPDNIKCIFCGRDIPNFEEKPYCPSCEKHLSFNKDKRCKICDVPIKENEIVCDLCKTHKRAFKKAFCPFLYSGIVRSNILSYKVDNKRYLSKSYAKLMYEYLKESNLKIDIITYVPVHVKTLKRRTFNQSKLLAEKLGELMNVPVVETLEKTIKTKQQKRLNYKERMKNLHSAFNVIDKKIVKGKNILLVDDIITTCATVNACSLKIMSAGASNIYVTAIARKEYNPNKQSKKNKNR